MKNNSVLKEVLKDIEPSKEDLKIIDVALKSFLQKIESKKKKLRISADVFVGGSFAKGTLIKKNNYDIDIFLRFDMKYRNENISEIAKRLLKDNEKFSIIHGSRDYFRVKIRENIFFEVIPLIKVKNPKESDNITDLSYFHVAYIKKKIKSKQIADDIKLAKVFCYANGCYGAESYINGFSGYSLELLIYHYKSFLNFVKAITKIKDKEIIDIEKHYKKKHDVLLDMNSAKLNSPIILIDPTYRQRNALAALSKTTFEKFQKICMAFLKNPSKNFFETKTFDIEKIRKDALKKKYEFILLNASTAKQEGDVAGSKLLKFFRHVEKEAEKYFEIKNRGFDYKEKKSAEFFLVVNRRKEIIISGPETKDKGNIGKFKKRHKNTFVKKNRVFAREKVSFTIKDFVNFWKKQNQRKIKEMAIEKLEIN
jgi:tRNA CCA-adding enzyme